MKPTQRNYMNTCTTPARRVLLSALITLAIAASCMLPHTAYAQTNADAAVANGAGNIAQTIKSAQKKAFTESPMANEFCIAQSGSGRCTIASTAMMVRRAAYLDGNANWQAIDEASVSADGWTSAGVKNEFETAGYSISYVSIDSSKESLIKLLEEHPEGIAAYDPSVPHAVLLSDYDAASDTFYCADPASYYSGSRIPVANSWNGDCRGGNQDAVISGFTSAWVINK